MIKKTKEFGINNNIQRKVCDKIGINSKKNFLKLKSNLLVKTENFLKKQLHNSNEGTNITSLDFMSNSSSYSSL